MDSTSVEVRFSNEVEDTKQELVSDREAKVLYSEKWISDLDFQRC